MTAFLGWLALLVWAALLVGVRPARRPQTTDLYLVTGRRYCVGNLFRKNRQNPLTPC